MSSWTTFLSKALLAKYETSSLWQTLGVFYSISLSRSPPSESLPLGVFDLLFSGFGGWRGLIGDSDMWSKLPDGNALYDVGKVTSCFNTHRIIQSYILLKAFKLLLPFRSADLHHRSHSLWESLTSCSVDLVVAGVSLVTVICDQSFLLGMLCMIWER